MIHHMNESSKTAAVDGPKISLSFLLSQFGSHATLCFEKKLSATGLRVQDAGLLRMLAARPGLTQIEIAEIFGVLPSRLVVIIDRLEEMAAVTRRRDTDDRRKVRIYLTAKGGDLAATIAKLTKSMDRHLFRALDEKERRQLEALVKRLIADQGLRAGVHPAFSKVIGGDDP
jgi:DNA-binding MarR family transcriptional regulator